MFKNAALGTLLSLALRGCQFQSLFDQPAHRFRTVRQIGLLAAPFIDGVYKFGPTAHADQFACGFSARHRLTVIVLTCYHISKPRSAG